MVHCSVNIVITKQSPLGVSTGTGLVTPVAGSVPNVTEDTPITPPPPTTISGNMKSPVMGDRSGWLSLKTTFTIQICRKMSQETKQFL